MKKSKLALITTLLAPAVLALSPGEKVPDIVAKNQDGKEIRLSEYRGKFVLLYFYPKDDTPGCTKEACSFRDTFADLTKVNGVIFGISRQGEASHQKFKQKYKLPFDLLIDVDGSIAKSLGIGLIPIIGLTKRKSILIGPDAQVIRTFTNVNPKTHAQEVLEEIRNAKR